MCNLVPQTFFVNDVYSVCYTRIRYAPYCSLYPDLIEAIVYEKTKKATQKKFNKLLDDYQVRLRQSMLAKLRTRTPMILVKGFKYLFSACECFEFSF